MIVGVICSDDRMIQVADKLSANNVVYKIFSEEDIKYFKQIHVLVLPVHGMNLDYQVKMWKSYMTLPKSFFNETTIVFQGIMENKNPIIKSRVFYYLEDESVKTKNAILTAEGVLKELIQHTCKSIYDVSIDLVGYGACGKAIVKMLNDLGVNVRVIRRNCNESKVFCSVDCWKICGDVIINTAPDKIVNVERLKSWNKVPLILDISNFDLFSEKDLEHSHINYYKLSNLPGYFSPISAGNIIADYIRRILYE